MGASPKETPCSRKKAVCIPSTAKCGRTLLVRVRNELEYLRLSVNLDSGYYFDECRSYSSLALFFGRTRVQRCTKTPFDASHRRLWCSVCTRLDPHRGRLGFSFSKDVVIRCRLSRSIQYFLQAGVASLHDAGFWLGIETLPITVSLWARKSFLSIVSCVLFADYCTKIGCYMTAEVFFNVWNRYVLLLPHVAQEGSRLLPIKALGQSDGNPAQWTACPPGGIDRTLLQDRSISILMFDDVVLFEDFIHDHGIVRLNVKIRVMPQCWYILLRYWLRVDNVVMKVCVTWSSVLQCWILVHFLWDQRQKHEIRVRKWMHIESSHKICVHH